METLKRGDWIGVLFDQKLNEGVPVPFFGRDAMTSPLPARLALAFRCPLVPTRTERLNGSHFRLTIYPPLELPETGDRNKDLEILMGRMNEMLEGWIREQPEQWFWVHKRWPD
jgi:KDO2-lipid IV(A) lauroyltransferase